MEFDVRQVLIRPLLTEKSDRLIKSSRQHSFEVTPNSSKGDIRRAVESLFKVKVTGVRTMNVAGKLKRQGRWQGYRSDWKKAIVTVAEGQTIQLEKI